MRLQATGRQEEPPPPRAGRGGRVLPGPPRERGPGDTLISDFWSQTVEEHISVVSESHPAGCFVTAAPGRSHSDSGPSARSQGTARSSLCQSSLLLELSMAPSLPHQASTPETCLSSPLLALCPSRICHCVCVLTVCLQHPWGLRPAAPPAARGLTVIE